MTSRTPLVLAFFCAGTLAAMGGCGDGRNEHSGGSATGAEGTLLLELPDPVPVGVPFPIIVRAADGQPVSGGGEVTVGAGAAYPFTLYRGRGSVSAVLGAEGPTRVRAVVGARVGEKAIAATRRPLRRLAGVLAEADLRWGVDADVVLDGLVQVPVGARLLIAAGTRVLGGAKANLDVAGEVEASGSGDAPILFTREGDSPWGQLKLLAGARGHLEHVLFTQAGGDESRQFKPDHSMSQAVVLADGAAELVVEGGGAIDNPGKCYSSRASRVTLRDVLVSRCDQGGEHDSTELLIEGSHYLEMPDADGRFEDDDNDGLHLGVDPARPAPMVVIRDSVFAVCEDDGIDQAGPSLLVERVWVEGMRHEGIATSAGGRITIEDSVVLRSENGIEAGWGQPDTVVRNTLLADNNVGLRWGDEYLMPNRGRLTASYVAVAGSRQANVLNWYTGGGYALPGAVAVSCSKVDTPEWDGQNGNQAGVVVWDGQSGCLPASGRMLEGCPEGPIGPRNGCP